MWPLTCRKCFLLLLQTRRPPSPRHCWTGWRCSRFQVGIQHEPVSWNPSLHSYQIRIPLVGWNRSELRVRKQKNVDRWLAKKKSKNIFKNVSNCHSEVTRWLGTTKCAVLQSIDPSGENCNFKSHPIMDGKCLVEEETVGLRRGIWRMPCCVELPWERLWVGEGNGRLVSVKLRNAFWRVGTPCHDL